MPGDIFGCHSCGRGYYGHLVADPGMLKSLQCTHRAALPAKNDPAQNVSGAKAEKPVHGNSPSVGT